MPRFSDEGPGISRTKWKTVHEGRVGRAPTGQISLSKGYERQETYTMKIAKSFYECLNRELRTSCMSDPIHLKNSGRNCRRRFPR